MQVSLLYLILGSHTNLASTNWVSLGSRVLSSALPVILLIRCIHTFDKAAARSQLVIENGLRIFESSCVKVWLLNILVLLERVIASIGHVCLLIAS